MSTPTVGTNLPLLYDRVLKYPERVQNLYFTYLFVLCAVTKAADYLEQAEYNTGNPEDDLKTQSLVKQLLYNPKLRSACPLGFDEAKLWQGENGPELKQEIQKQFRNISAIMDCVGCEKCQLWGKLQVLCLNCTEFSSLLMETATLNNQYVVCFLAKNIHYHLCKMMLRE